MNGGRQSNGALRPLLLVWVVIFFGDFFLVPQPQQTRTSLETPGICFGFFCRVEPNTTRTHRQTPQIAIARSFQHAGKPSYRPLPPRNCGLRALAAGRSLGWLAMPLAFPRRACSSATRVSTSTFCLWPRPRLVWTLALRRVRWLQEEAVDIRMYRRRSTFRFRRQLLAHSPKRSSSAPDLTARRTRVAEQLLFAFFGCSIRIFMRNPCVLHFECFGRWDFQLNDIFMKMTTRA